MATPTRQWYTERLKIINNDNKVNYYYYSNNVGSCISVCSDKGLQKQFIICVRIREFNA